MLTAWQVWAPASKNSEPSEESSCHCKAKMSVGVEAEVTKLVSLARSKFAPFFSQVSADADVDEAAQKSNNMNCKAISLSFLLLARDLIVSSSKSMRENLSVLETLSIETVVNKILVPAAKTHSQQGHDK